MRDDVIAQLEHLANVEPGTLGPLLHKHWHPGDELLAAERIDALRKSYVNRAAAARRHAKPLRADVPERVDTLVETKAVKGGLRAAFERVANDLNLSPDTVRNAYYKERKRDPVNTSS